MQKIKELLCAKFVTSVSDTNCRYLKFKFYYILSALKKQFKTAFPLLRREVPHVHKIDWSGILCATPSCHAAATQ